MLCLNLKGHPYLRLLDYPRGMGSKIFLPAPQQRKKSEMYDTTRLYGPLGIHLLFDIGYSDGCKHLIHNSGGITRCCQFGEVGEDLPPSGE